MNRYALKIEPLDNSEIRAIVFGQKLDGRIYVESLMEGDEEAVRGAFCGDFAGKDVLVYAGFGKSWVDSGELTTWEAAKSLATTA